jgi:hypothetical protein
MNKPIIYFLTILLAFVACETDDVVLPVGEGPEVNFSLDPIIITENGGIASISATLVESTENEVIVSFAFGGTAVKGVDYTVSSENLVIMQGVLSNQITITAIDNNSKEDNRIIEISIASISGGSSSIDKLPNLTIEDDETPNTAALIINEVLYDPPAGAAGDANGDGTRDANQDEFVELVNLSASPMDISNYKMYDATALSSNAPRHIFPSGSIIPPGKAIIIFGGGAPTGSFGNATVQIASSGSLNLTNADDLLTIEDANGTVILTFDVEALSNNPDESYTRNPDLTGEFEQHGANTPLLFSPGSKVDSNPF